VGAVWSSPSSLESDGEKTQPMQTKSQSREDFKHSVRQSIRQVREHQTEHIQEIDTSKLQQDTFVKAVRHLCTIDEFELQQSDWELAINTFNRAVTVKTAEVKELEAEYERRRQECGHVEERDTRNKALVELKSWRMEMIDPVKAELEALVHAGPPFQNSAVRTHARCNVESLIFAFFA
jgi:hypothetical protein